MNSRDIVRKAWQITQVHLKKLIWYGAVPAFFSTVVSSGYLAYQYNAFRHSELFGGQAATNVRSLLGIAWGFINNYPWLTVMAIIFIILFLLGYVLVRPIFHGTLISAIDRIREYKPIEGSLEIGVRRFFPMFEFCLLTGTFSVLTLFTEGSFIIRWWGVNIFFAILPFLLFISMVGLIASFLFTYSEYFIVLQDRRLIESIKESVILVIANLRRTILIFILMLLIAVRVILNVILVLLIPMLIVVLSTYFATVFYSVFGIILICVFGLGVLLLASYLLGLFHIFTTAVWVLTFSILSQKEEPKIKDVDLGNDAPVPPHISPA